jgi:hypothetical protein
LLRLLAKSKGDTSPFWTPSNAPKVP